MLLGLVGKPSSGKSTFFKASTLAEVAIASYPFTTIKPNHGAGYVKIECIDKEFGVQCQPRMGFCINHKRFVPVDLMDVAGLVPGASQGKGLGNQFLDDLRQADTFIHVVDASGTTDEEGKKTENHDPCKDIRFLEEELDLWYLGILSKVWQGFARGVQMTHKNLVQEVAKQFSGLKVKEEDVKLVLIKTGLDSEKPVSWTPDELRIFAHELRHLTKPMIIAANKSDMPNAKENIEKIKKTFPELLVVPCSADSELALREAAKAGLIDYVPGENNFVIKKVNDKQKQALEHIKKNVLEVYGSTGIQEVLNTAVFKLLKYIAIFPAGVNKLADSKGNILPDCFLLPEGSTALDFAFAIHTDIGKNFVKAMDAKTKLAVGKEHKLKHRDAVEIITR
jgi:ribosome-binding ATPase YchF (GTP1/OBG family)